MSLTIWDYVVLASRAKSSIKLGNLRAIETDYKGIFLIGVELLADPKYSIDFHNHYITVYKNTDTDIQYSFPEAVRRLSYAYCYELNVNWDSDSLEQAFNEIDLYNHQSDDYKAMLEKVFELTSNKNEVEKILLDAKINSLKEDLSYYGDLNTDLLKGVFDEFLGSLRKK